MKSIKSCEFNMDTGCVELRFADGSMIAIDCTAVENEVADNLYERSELDYRIYNDPLAYAAHSECRFKKCCDNCRFAEAAASGSEIYR